MQCETAVGDGLDDVVETKTGVYVSLSNTGTDPQNSDTDGDSVNDGQEVIGENWPVLTSSNSYIMSVNRGTGGTADPDDNKKRAEAVTSMYTYIVSVTAGPFTRAFIVFMMCALFPITAPTLIMAASKPGFL